MEPFIGEIRAFPYNFEPRGWLFCNGQLLPIASNTTLFSIIGTTYGGDGRTTFQLPNLQSRVVPGAGQGAGLSPWHLGQREGSAQVALQETELPPHRHTLTALDNTGTEETPDAESYLARDVRGGSGVVSYVRADAAPDAMMAGAALSVSGNGQAHENRQPFLTVNFCIAIQGVFPPRS